LTNGTENIRFDNIRWTGSDNRTGTYRFSYDNDEYHGSGAYHGRVTYTLSSHLKGSRQNQCLIMNQ
jgi:hypothetical protein